MTSESTNESQTAEMEIDSDEYINAVDISFKNQSKAITMFEKLILQDDPDDKLQKTKEEAIYRLGELYIKIGQVQALKDLLKNIRPFLVEIPKAKTAKIVRTLLDFVAKVPKTEELQILLCKESIEWCKQEKRTFLRQRIESRVATLLLKSKHFKDSLALLKTLQREVKKLDDKLLLVEIFLTESYVHMELKNVPVAKASLTAARSSSNAVYCPPDLQAEIDLQSGIISAAEKDYKTAFSYFYESFEGFNTINDPDRAVRALKYMLLTKILTNCPGDVYSIISGKAGLKFVGREVNAMRAVAEAHQKSSLHEFQEKTKEFSDQLVDDPIVHSHLQRVYQTLWEKNLLRIIEPYSCVEISHVAELIDMKPQIIEQKLSEMILDKKLNGILDQGKGQLVIFEESGDSRTYEAALGTIRELEGVVEKLQKKSEKLI